MSIKIGLTTDTHYGFNQKSYRVHIKFWKKMYKEFKEKGVKALIWTGDASSNSQRQLYKTLTMAREELNDIPIIFCKGNHDYWDGEFPRTISELNYLHSSWFSELNIKHIQDGPVTIDDVILCGWDGWYGASNPPTNDEYNMHKNVEGCPTMVYLSSKAWKDFEKVIDTDISGHRKSICITHFPTFSVDPFWNHMCANFKFHPIIKDKFDVFCSGHSHKFSDRVEDGCRILNAGSDYGKPEYFIFEV